MRNFFPANIKKYEEFRENNEFTASGRVEFQDFV